MSRRKVAYAKKNCIDPEEEGKKIAQTVLRYLAIIFNGNFEALWSCRS